MKELTAADAFIQPPPHHSSIQSYSVSTILISSQVTCHSNGIGTIPRSCAQNWSLEKGDIKKESQAYSTSRAKPVFVVVVKSSHPV